MKLDVLIVEDNADDMRAFLRDFPAVFTEKGIAVTLHTAVTFNDAKTITDDASRRFDLILSDTYRGEHAKGDAAVLEMISYFRNGKFCPLVVFSASAKPEDLQPGPFVMWADKTVAGGIESAIREMLATGVPQAARHLHDELDRLGGSYLWEFLEANWDRLQVGGHVEGDLLGRMIRRRAALQLADIEWSDTGGTMFVEEVHGLEFYMYPSVYDRFGLGQILRKRTDHSDVRVVLTPHCYLVAQTGQAPPRAEFVRVVKAVAAETVLGIKLTNARALNAEQRAKKLRTFTNPPSGQDVGAPEGRYWYLPSFLDIPHLYCDFMQIDSIPYAALRADYEALAVLTPPYAESLQSCCKAFDSAVGIPRLKPGVGTLVG
jgi:hypothetical protein